MKLAILAQAYLFDETAPINGSLVQIYNLAQGFKNNGIEVHYIAVTKDRRKPDYELNQDIHFHWIQKRESYLHWKSLMKHYNSVLNKVSPDALYVRGRNTLQYVAGIYAKKHNGVFVWGMNGDDSAEFWKNLKRLKQSNKSLLKKMLLYPLKTWEDLYINKGMTLPNHIVNQNTYQKEQTLKLLNREGVVLNSYYSLAMKKQTTIKKQVLWLARWSKEKQPELFLNMISKLNFPNIKFVMGGDTNNIQIKSKLIEGAKKLQVSTPGKIDYTDVNDYFANTLVFVNTSYREGISNTFIEAMLNGVPVLSLNSNPNNWLTDYNIGYCANGNIEDLTQILGELLVNKEKLNTMSKAARQFAEQHFSNNNIIKSYIKLFQKDA